MREFDLIVIGSGPAGQKAAIQGARLRKRVAIIEKETVLGGAGVNTGTLPSKTLNDTIYHIHGYTLRSFLNATCTLKKNITFKDLMARKNQAASNDNTVLRHQLERNNITIIHGTATLIGPHTVQVAMRNGKNEPLFASFVVIATGSRPRRPDNVPFNNQNVCDSDAILSTDVAPESILVVGGGVIGMEYASMFNVFGLEVILLERRKELFRFVDLEVTRKLIEHLKLNGVQFILEQDITQVVIKKTGKVATTIQGGETIITDMLLYAMGRTAQTHALGLPAAGVEIDTTGQIKVDECYRTNVAHIYAAGDVIGFPGLASTSMEQGRRAACHAFGVALPETPKIWPYGIYTIPEISLVGKTEEELKQESVPYKIGRAFYKEITHGQNAGDTMGFMKLLFHRESRKLLGVHIV
ncbi:MAG: Si-specific NAD(P)(+) transhydrogenase, partial [Planctomycetota bacterium]